MTGRVTHAYGWAGLSSIVRALLALGQLALLARAMSPSEFALGSITLAVVGLIGALGDAGFSSAIIRFRDLTATQRDTVYWLNVSTGVGLCILLDVLAPHIASVLALPDLAVLLTVSSPILIFGAVGLQFRVVAERAFSFRRLALVEVSASAFGATAAIVYVSQVGGAMALVVGQLATSIALMALSIGLAPTPWKPTLRLSFSNMRGVISYGADIFLVNAGIALVAQADVLVAARILPVSELPLFSSGRDMCLRAMGVVNPVINRVLVPAIAAARGDAKAVGGIYSRSIAISTWILFPVYGGMAQFADPLVSVVLGEQWASAAHILPGICLWFAARSVGNPIGSLMYGLGKSRLAVLYQSVVVVSVLTAVAIGSVAGVFWLPWALAASSILLIEIGWYYVLRRWCGVTFASFHKSLASPVLATAIAGGLAKAVWWGVATLHDGVVAIASGAAVFLVVVLASGAHLNSKYIHKVAHGVSEAESAAGRIEAE